MIMSSSGWLNVRPSVLPPSFVGDIFLMTWLSLESAYMQEQASNSSTKKKKLSSHKNCNLTLTLQYWNDNRKKRPSFAVALLLAANLLLYAGHNNLPSFLGPPSLIAMCYCAGGGGYYYYRKRNASEERNTNTSPYNWACG